MNFYCYKFRIYPTQEQQAQIAKNIGCARFVYNYYLDRRQKLYQENKQTFGFNACCKDLTSLKKELPWLQEADSQGLIKALRALDDAYQNFFRNIKEGRKPGYPQFKSKGSERQSYTTAGQIHILADAVQLPKLGIVSCKISRPVEGRVLAATISKKPSGKYYVSIRCKLAEPIPPLPTTGAVVGLDLGIKHLAVSSDGTKYENPHNLKKLEKQLVKAQRQLSRKTRGSNREKKANKKLAVLHERIANQRNDTIHKTTTEIVREYDVICIEDLDVKGMLQKKHFSKELSDAALGEVKRQLQYKADWYGKTLIKTEKNFPANQICSKCGQRNTDINNPAIQAWTCPNCGVRHDRRENAATNILKQGLAQQKS